MKRTPCYSRQNGRLLGCSSWKPDAVIGTTGRKNQPLAWIFKGRRERTGFFQLKRASTVDVAGYEYMMLQSLYWLSIDIVPTVPSTQPDNYIAFGISGSDTAVQMVGGDVTWTWLDDEGVHAQDLDLTAYAQVRDIPYSGKFSRGIKFRVFRE